MPIDTAQNTIQNPYTPIADRWRNATKDWKRDAAKQATIAGAEFDADLALLDYQNQYNDPTAKAERMRAAGLNPDLVGLDGAGDSAGLSGVTGSAGISTGPSSQERAQFWLSQGQNIFNSALQLADQFQTMRGRSLDNDLKNIQYVTALRSLNDSASSEASAATLLESLFMGHDARDFSRSLFLTGLSKRNQKRIFSLLPTIRSESGAYSLLKDRFDSMLSSSETMQFAKERSGKREDFDISDLMKGYEHIAEFLEKVNKNVARQDAAQSGYNADYYEHASGSTDAGIDSEIRSISRDSAKDSYDASKGNKELDKFFSEMVTGLRKDDSWFSNVLLTILYGMKSGAFQGGLDFYNGIRPSRVRGKSK